MTGYWNQNPMLIGDSTPMRRLRALVETVAPTRLAVLIEGPTGSGKELIAGLLHRQSKRTGALVAFNVCAVGETMFEDALFGHVRGAYTGALHESLGFLREANGGTAFLDEISGLPLGLQAKLLRALETGVFRPIGASRDAQSDFRLVTATNERLGMLVRDGRFRDDLRHRLSGVVIAVPSLADRIDDLPLLVGHFVRRAAGTDLPVTVGAMRALMAADWPGNVRELKQVIDAAVAFARGRIDGEALDAAMMHRAYDAPSRVHGAGVADRLELETLLAEVGGDVDRAAAMLGIHRATLYRRIKRHGVEVQRVAACRATSLTTRATTATAPI